MTADVFGERQTLTSREAYLAMLDLIDGKKDWLEGVGVVPLLGSGSLLPDGTPVDPAFIEEWNASVGRAISGQVDANLRLTP
ncbi:MAG: hypothetical protein AAF366_17680 [Pseudomonadota bacterium]